MAVAGISFPTPQAYSGGADFAPLAKLGDVYQAAQARQRQLSALSQLGSDPTANAQALIQSGDPTLATQGLTLQGQQATRAEQQSQHAEAVREFEAQQRIRQAQEKRAQETFDEDSATGRAQKLKAAGLDPNDPMYRGYIVTGQNLPDPNKINAPMREVQGYFQAGKSLGMTDEQATAFAANGGKMPKADLSAGEEKRVNTLTDQASTAERTRENIAQLKELSKTAWGFPGAGTASEYAATFLPSWAGGKGAVDTQDLINAAHSNVANVAKTIFPQRVTNTDLQLLKELESSANQPDEVRQRIYTRADAMFKRLSEQSTAEAEGIRNKTFYKPGGSTPAAPTGAPAATAAPAAAAPAATTAKPSLKEFMDKARAANPGWSDSELATKWKERYGGS